MQNVVSIAGTFTNRMLLTGLHSEGFRHSGVIRRPSRSGNRTSTAQAAF
jgi:hypothetical protein